MDTPYRWRWLALGAVLVAEIMDLLDATIVGVAAPSVQRDLGGGATTIQWVAAGYTLAYAVGLVTGARLGDLLGRRRVFLVGLAGFVLTSALCGLATTPGALIAFRVLQGLCGAVLVPQGFGIVRTAFPPAELGRAFGTFGPAIGLAAVAGPIVAGALVAADVAGLGWRAVFLVNVPIGLAGLALAWAVLPESRAEDVRGGLRSLDLGGMLLAGLGLAVAVVPLVQGRELGWPVWAVVLPVAAVPLLAVFGWHQVRRSRAGRPPLVEPALFRIRAFTGGTVVGLVFFAGMTGLVLVLGLYLQLELGFTPLEAGLTQAPWALGVAAGSVLGAGVLAPRLGRGAIQLGAGVMTAGVLGLLPALGSNPVTGWSLAPALVVCGAGMGVLLAPFFDIVLAGVDGPLVGSASGVLNAVQQLGAAVGVATVGTVWFQVTAGAGMTAGFRVVLVVVAVTTVVAGALTVLLPRRAGTAGPAPEEAPEPAAA
ncbi:MFS transporter [Pseudonocardia yuanmonensis]|uniref:MFS transporter n=1 Tax=Pseudonocardia yuanmonensis TaxID=1095914 RepID=UPI0031ED6C30